MESYDNMYEPIEEHEPVEALGLETTNIVQPKSFSLSYLFTVYSLKWFLFSLFLLCFIMFYLIVGYAKTKENIELQKNKYNVKNYIEFAKKSVDDLEKKETTSNTMSYKNKP